MGLEVLLFAISTAVSLHQQRQAKKKAAAAKDAALGQDVRPSNSAEPIDVNYGRIATSGTQVWVDTRNQFNTNTFNTDNTLSSDDGGFTFTTARLNQPNDKGKKNEFLGSQHVIGIGKIEDVTNMWVDDQAPNSEFISGSAWGRWRTDGKADPAATAFQSTRNTAKFTDLSYATTVYKLNRDDPQYSGSPLPLFFIKGNRLRGIERTGTPGNYVYSLETEANASFTANAALVLLDYLIGEDYGLGWTVRNSDDSEYASSDIDLEAFYEAQQICGQVVQHSSGLGSTDITPGGQYPFPIFGGSGTGWLPPLTVSNQAAYDQLGLSGSGPLGDTRFQTFVITTAGTTLTLDNTATSITSITKVDGDDTETLEASDYTHVSGSATITLDNSTAVGETYYVGYKIGNTVAAPESGYQVSAAQDATGIQRGMLRYEYNGGISTGANHRDNISTILGVIPGYEFFRSPTGQWKLVVPNSLDSATDQSVGTIGPSDLVGNISVSYPDSANKLNHLDIRFPNINKDYADDTVSFPPVVSASDDPDNNSLYRNYLDLDNNVQLSNLIDVRGIIEEYHAHQWAANTIAQSRRESYTFRTRPKGFLYEPGDIVKLEDSEASVDVYVKIITTKVLPSLEVEFTALAFDPNDYGWNTLSYEAVANRGDILAALDKPPTPSASFVTGSRLVDITWSYTNEDDEDATIVGYIIEASLAGSGDTEEYTVVGQTLTTPAKFRHYPGEGSSTYKYRIVAITSDGRRSAPSDASTAESVSAAVVAAAASLSTAPAVIAVDGDGNFVGSDTVITLKFGADKANLVDVNSDSALNNAEWRIKTVRSSQTNSVNDFTVGTLVVDATDNEVDVPLSGFVTDGTLEYTASYKTNGGDVVEITGATDVIQAATGAKGDKGVVGDKGDDGEKGTGGDKGEDGDKGDDGVPGLPGAGKTLEYNNVDTVIPVEDDHGHYAFRTVFGGSVFATTWSQIKDARELILNELDANSTDNSTYLADDLKNGDLITFYISAGQWVEYQMTADPVELSGSNAHITRYQITRQGFAETDGTDAPEDATDRLVEFRFSRVPSGDKGPKGVLGDTGAKGDTGDKGDDGAKGDTGEDGDKGTKGILGDQGSKGETGTGGEKGTKGEGGDAGTKGTKGEDGDQGPKGDEGDAGEKGTKGIVGDQGPKGDEGDQGTKGVKGTAGETGPKGDEGDAGEKGTKGVTGDQGPKGDEGDAGEKGTKGIAGDQGPKGDEGDSGEKGTKGIAGETGPKGDEGDSGEKGTKGVAGDQGPKGDEGDAGEKGTKGIVGDQGPKGDEGDQGTKGLVGEAGSKGPKGDEGEGGTKGTKGEDGDEGPKGDEGDQGAKGIVGEGGTKGPKGDEGEAGAKGNKGDTGDQGPKGDEGDQGEKGTKGIDGDSGPKGDQGDQGTKGINGEAGTKGPKGDDGDQGIKGATGADGERGPKGDEGEAGTKGAKGIVGDSGPKGDEGDQGEKGTKGEGGGTGQKGNEGDKGIKGSDGEQGLKGSIGEDGSKGPKGDTGDGGTKGTKGEDGDDGPKGIVGDTGDKGVKGITGEQGPKGEANTTKGAKGPDGDDGDKGPKGTQGEEGIKGPKGTEQGDPGPKGQQGDAGDKGTKGETGETGTKGTAGEDGEKGPKGDTGTKGDTGEDGEKGAKGETGAQGIKGSTGDGGEKGTKGIGGDQGAKGQTGETGTKGVKGIDGDGGAKGQTGETGTKGTKGQGGDGGAKGQTGETGQKGTKGIGGDTGAKGQTGETGTKGTKGEAGTDGAKGQTGETGTKGTKGEDGTDGAKGQTGETGTKGTKGLAGDGGAKGQTGETGTKGTKGEAGTDGAKGQTGETGTKGTKGLAGDGGAKGQTGETGTKGTKGQSGDGGAKGQTGETGQKGTKGINGDGGAKGQTGETGTKGTKGEAGTDGAKGQTGETGTKGTKGQAGDGGAKGQTGETGTKGTKGLAGDGGAKGQTGETGTKGTKGEAGTDGAKGQTGETGTKGTKGLAGDGGAKGQTGETGTKGTKGQGGDGGTKGQMGENGQKGIKGIEGDGGAKGSPGEDGDKGPKGIDGDTGVKGAGGNVGDAGNAIVFEADANSNVDTDAEYYSAIYNFGGRNTVAENDIWWNIPDGDVYQWQNATSTSSSIPSGQTFTQINGTTGNTFLTGVGQYTAYVEIYRTTTWEDQAIQDPPADPANVTVTIAANGSETFSAPTGWSKTYPASPGDDNVWKAWAFVARSGAGTVTTDWSEPELVQEGQEASWSITQSPNSGISSAYAGSFPYARTSYTPSNRIIAITATPTSGTAETTNLTFTAPSQMPNSASLANSGSSVAISNTSDFSLVSEGTASGSFFGGYTIIWTFRHTESSQTFTVTQTIGPPDI